jgi:hydroxyethylthiazole kinase-like uncharacterized protein yjeF
VKRLPRRRPDTHKGDYGRVLVVAGSPGMCGAAALAATAAHRAGAGLVYVACPERVADVLSIKLDCAVIRPFPAEKSADRILEQAADCDVAVVGPGLSRAPDVVDALRELVPALQIPFVLDADGLNAFEGHPDLLARGHAPRVLTPHPGEAARLLGRPAAELQKDREAAAVELAKRFLAVAVLKGHRTLISDGAKTAVNRTGNPGMATGGTGDVLAGVIGALIGQGLSPFDAAVYGVHVHGKAGDLARTRVGEVSMMATDLLDALPAAFKSGR